MEICDQPRFFSGAADIVTIQVERRQLRFEYRHVYLFRHEAKGPAHTLSRQLNVFHSELSR